uniref:Uncharacterized protein n=1 Tax=Ananas comosus var. bracteatus TaxID=296719 RepID=A0A6V7PTJ4_ANACO|nr:unnamed protein product [Ananas comosus var. bracteatus]
MVTSGSVPSAPPHFVLVPLLAQGHLIPAMDIAALLTARGAAVTLIATPVNAARLRPLADRLVASSSHSGPFRLAELPFPAAPSASPRAARTSTSSPPRPSTSASSAPPQRSAGPSPPSSAPCRPRPSCLVADMFSPWAADVAADLGLPRLVFHGPSCLTVLSFLSAQRHGLIGPGAAAAEPFEIPGVPHRITATRAEVPGWFNVPAFEELLRSILEAEAAADGVVLNTFEFLEGDSAAAYGAMLGKPVHCIGPLCLSTKDSVGNVGRGGDAAVDTGRCVEWLAAKNPRSVIYVSFGSLTYVPPKQVIEIGEGLAAAGAPFVFVIKKSEVASPEVAQWLSGEGGFEDRNKEKGMLAKAGPASHSPPQQQWRRRLRPNTPTHFVLVPFMAQGHLIPAMDIAALLTARGAAVTLITTPVNAARLRPLADRLVASSSHSGPFRLAELPFPAASFGLPEGCESLDLIPSPRLVLNLFRAAAALRGPLTSLLRSCRAAALVPRRRHLPGLGRGRRRRPWHPAPPQPRLLRPHRALLPLRRAPRPQRPRRRRGGALRDPREIKRSTLEAEATADGLVLNTFELLEGDIAAAYAAMLGKPVYCIGPLCLSTKDTVGSVGRGGDAAVDAGRCVEWLAAKKPRSVIYVGFGSLSYVPPKQVIEIGEGLAAAGAPFVLVIKQTELAPEVTS